MILNELFFLYHLSLNGGEQERGDDGISAIPKAVLSFPGSSRR
jgi:hypothetical protein